MADVLPGLPSREPNHVSPADNPLLPRRETGPNLGQRLDPPTRGQPIDRDDDEGEITIVLDGNGAQKSSAAEKSDFQKLREELSAERQRARALEIAAQKQMAQVTRQQIDVAHATAYTQHQALIKEAAEALNAGEYTKAMQLQGDAGYQAARIAALVDGRAALDQQAKQQPVDPVAQQEAWLREQERHAPENAKWIREHPQFFTDNAFQAKAVAASGYALNVLGLKTSDPDYIRVVDEAVGLRDNGSRRVKDGRATVYSAPPSRPNGGVDYQPRSETVTLTPAQRDIARALFSGPEYRGRDPEIIYAANLAAIRRERGER